MRVGLISIYDNTNMGNRLQNYALQQMLFAYAHEVYTIKNKVYSPRVLQNVIRASLLSESVWANRLLGKRRKVCLLRFNKRHIATSRNRYWYNRRCKTLAAKDQCDLYCAGSDQVWNPTISRGTAFDFLCFAERERTFAYAASFGVDRIPEQHKDAVRKGLQHIKHISVREEAGKRIVEELTGRTDAQVLVDPTMLLTTQQWDEIAERPKGPLPDKYLLTYFLGNVSEKRKQAICALADSRTCTVINLMDPKGPFYAIGPGEFVYLIKNADCVCTDSFHGSVFSFLYERPLAIFQREGSVDDMSSRLVTLSEKFHLQDCLVHTDALPAMPERADYTAGYVALEQEREKATAFLTMVFQEAERAGVCN